MPGFVVAGRAVDGELWLMWTEGSRTSVCVVHHQQQQRAIEAILQTAAELFNAHRLRNGPMSAVVYRSIQGSTLLFWRLECWHARLSQHRQ